MIEISPARVIVIANTNLDNPSFGVAWNRIGLIRLSTQVQYRTFTKKHETSDRMSKHSFVSFVHPSKVGFGFGPVQLGWAGFDCGYVLFCSARFGSVRFGLVRSGPPGSGRVGSGRFSWARFVSETVVVRALRAQELFVRRCRVHILGLGRKKPHDTNDE